jgi:PAS domain S-box-containing protein
MDMTPSHVMLAGTYDYRLVVLSIVISCMASYAALDLGGRVTSARGVARLLWLGGGAIAMGIGIWSMHYIGMLAFHLPVPVLYDWPTVILSLLAAIAASAIALVVASRPQLSVFHAAIGSLFMGAGIAAMHYIGMAAMRLPATAQYSSPLVALSVVLAMAISFVALWLTFHFRSDVAPLGWKKIASALVMGAAIPVMHYTGMAAATFVPGIPVYRDHWSAVSVSALGMTGIVGATVMALALALITSMVDRQYSVQIRGRRRAESALIDSERTHQVTLDAAPIGIAHVSLDGRWLRVNHRLCDLLGRTSAELRATDVLTLTHPDDAVLSETTRQLVVAGGADRRVFEARLLRGDGRYIWAGVTITVHADAAGDPTYLVMIIEDITERRSLEEQVRQAQKMEAIGLLAAGVAHDFNNLLTVMVGFSELTLRSLEPEHPSRPDIEESLHAARSAGSLARQLLILSRKQNLQPELVNLNVVVERMEMLLKRTIGGHVQLRLVLDPSIGTVNADPGQIEQVLMNLTLNARDAMPGGGVIGIETRDDGSHIHIAVSDTGTGITEAVRAHLFEPFFTTKEPGKGTGLGLATVYGIVKQSGGSIRVDSEPGHGATFTVSLPKAEEAVDDAPAPAATPRSARGSETILVAEDQPEVSSIIRATLTRHGYTILSADAAEDALRMAREHDAPIHLLLTDVLMPGMNGHELADRLTTERPEMRVLYTSGSVEHAIVRDGVIDAGRPFLSKPFSPEVLLTKVRNVLDSN